MKKKQNILVTGGAGFLGSHLCKKLLDEENRVICLDNLFSCDISNINDLFKYKNVIMTSTSVKKIQQRILNEKN